jgi:hypothetical protein
MRQSVLLRIAADPIARVWSGVGDLDIPADIVEPSLARYLGGGQLVNIPELEQVINGTASRIEITVSGVNAQTLALATEEAESVKGAACHIGIAYFDADWQLDDVEWIAVLRADFLTTARQGNTRSITISIGTDDTDRSRAPVAFWTDADQRRRSPTDRFFDHIAGISSGTSRRFGPND